MIAGKVVGSVISTRKCENLVGNKFMIVDVLDHMQTSGKQLIAIDITFESTAQSYGCKQHF